jgi:hypothetical protein
MKKEELRNMIREELKKALADMGDDTSKKEICEGEGCLDEKSVPEPYNRKGARKMTKGQIEKRDRIGKAMEKDEKTVSKFRKTHGQDWKSYLWAAASAAAFRQK